MSLDLTYEKTGRNGTVALIVKDGDELVAAEKVDVLKSASRDKLIDGLCTSRPQLDRKLLRARLVEIAADILRAPPDEQSTGAPDQRGAVGEDGRGHLGRSGKDAG